MVSIVTPGRTLTFACVYCSPAPGKCIINFFDKFVSFVGFLSFQKNQYYIYGDFNIHVVVPGSDGHKFMILLEFCNIKQSVNQATNLHGPILDLSLSPCNQDSSVDVKICDFVSDHALVNFTFPMQQHKK